MKKLNNITGNEYSDEWFTPKEIVLKCYEILDPKSRSVILCPFDSQESYFVKIGQEQGHKVIFGITDFLEKDYEFDYLITNPPFSIKDRVIERVFRLGKPATMVLPLDTLGGVKRHSLYKEFGYPEIYVPTKRINYFDNTWTKPAGGSSVHSVILTLNRGTGITWE
jgi:hypothetical protein